MSKIKLAALTLVTLAAGSGCSKKDVGQTFVTAMSASATPAGSKKGLGNPKNKPEVVALVQKVLDSCKDKWDGKKGYDECSEPMKEFREKTGKLEKTESTYLDILEDDRIEVRYLAASGLSNGGFDLYSSKELAPRLVDMLEKEKAPSPLDAELAYLASRTNESAGVWPRLAALALAPDTSTDVKAVLAGWWRGGESAYPAVKAYSTSPDKKLVFAAAQGWALHFDKHADEACAFWSSHFDDEDKDVRRSSVGHLTGGWSGNTTHDTEGNWYITGGGGGPSSGGDNACKEKDVDAALTAIDKRATANTIDDSNYIYGLESIAKHKKSNAKEKKEAVAILRKIVETKGASQRSFALRKLVDVDPKEKAYAAKFAKEPDLKYTVESITQPKK